MSDKTKIEWTDATWNIITGCSVVSAGCKNCYAMKLAGGAEEVTS
jgi:protein gp37